MNRLFCLITLFSCLLSSLAAQESLGLHMDNYSGTDLMLWNPANATSSANKWDITLGSTHLFGFSDYAFLRNSSLFGLINDVELAQVIDARGNIPNDSDTRPLLIYDEDFGDKIFSTKLNVSGPAISLQINEKWRVGLFTRMRAHATAPDIPEPLGVFELNDARFVNFTLNLVPVSGAALYFFEFGGHVSTQLFDDWSIGGNIKAQIASEGFFLDSNTRTAIPFDPERISGLGISGGRGFFEDISLGTTNNTINSEEFSPFDNLDSGIGLGIDLGARITKETWSAGLSIIDFGFVRMRNNAELYTILNSFEELFFDDYLLISSPREALDQIVSDLGSDIFIDNGFSIGLPTGLVLQGSVKLNAALNLSGQFTQRIPLFNNSLARENSIAVVPHYSTKWLSLFTPITLYEYSQVRVGFAARIGFLTVGSDHLGTLFRDHDFRGSDLYVKLSVFPFSTNRSKKSKDNNKGKSSVKCYTF